MSESQSGIVLSQAVSQHTWKVFEDMEDQPATTSGQVLSEDTLNVLQPFKDCLSGHYGQYKSDILATQNKLQDTLELDQFEEVTGTLLANYKRTATTRRDGPTPSTMGWPE